MCGKNTSGRTFQWFFLWLTHGLVLSGDGGALGILLTFPQEYLAFEAAGTSPSESEEGEHANTRWVNTAEMLDGTCSEWSQIEHVSPVAHFSHKNGMPSLSFTSWPVCSHIRTCALHVDCMKVVGVFM